MFSPEDILTLSKAGFTAQQIAGLSIVSNNPVQAPAAAPAAAPAKAPSPAPAPAPAPAQAPAQKDPILSELEKLTGLMQRNNILAGNVHHQKTANDILAEIINPPIKNKE